MSLPADITTITITGTLALLDGTPLSGNVIWDAGPPVTDLTGKVILGGPVRAVVASGRMTAADGSPLVLPHNDSAGIREPGFAYTVTIAVPGISQPPFQVLLPSSLGASADLSALVEVNPPPPYSTVYGVLTRDNDWTGGNTFGGDITIPPGAVSGYVLTSDSGGAATWQPAPGGTGSVVSVNGQHGIVVLTASDVGADASGAAATRLPLAGGTLTGALTLAADPSSSLQAATKQYVDSHGGGGAVASVNGHTGTVVLGAADVGADASGAAAAAQTAAATYTDTETARAQAAEALKLAKASNLSDLASAATARTNLGLGTAATQASSAFDASGAAAAETTRAQAAEALLAPLASPALTGSPTAPTQTSGDSTTKIATDAFVTTAVAAETARATTAEGLAAQKASNLSDLASASTARTNLGLGTAATQASAAFDAAGAAATAQATAEAASLPLAGGTMAGAIAMGLNKITGIADGSGAQDAAAFHQIPSSLPPSGSAGGDVTGTYPASLTVSKVQGVALGTNPGGTTAFLRADGTWATPAGGGSSGLGLAYAVARNYAMP